MDRLRQFPFLWFLGAVNLVFSAVGIFAAASLVGLPLVLASAALGIDQEKVVEWLIYGSPLWAPVGAGAGLGAARAVARGLMRKDPDKARE